MTDSEVAADLNTVYRTRDRDIISGGEVWNNTDATEFGNLQSQVQDRWLSFCGIDEIDPFGPAVDFVTSVFSAGSTTLSNLSDLRTDAISRAAELGLGEVEAYDVAKAREQLGVV